MAQFDTPLGRMNFGEFGISEHNPSFDSLMHRVYALDSRWVNTSGATMRHTGNGLEVTRDTLVATLRHILSMYEESD